MEMFSSSRDTEYKDSVVKTSDLSHFLKAEGCKVLELECCQKILARGSIQLDHFGMATTPLRLKKRSAGWQAAFCKKKGL